MKSIQVLLIYTCIVNNTLAHWSYKEGNGTHDWTGVCLTGHQQSPIDLSSGEVTKVRGMEPIHFQHYDEPPEVEQLTNNGHSVTFTLEESDDAKYPKISKGGLPGVFKFSQFHFHWGSEDKQGSEHTIHGEVAPMEMHLVHFNEKYGKDINEALANSKGAWDTLAVVGVFFQVQEEDNHNFDHIVEELKFVQFLDQSIKNVTVFPLNKVLPKNLSNFWRYNGSLTSPPCSEIVIWTIFKTPVSISEEQLNRFREIVDVDETSDVKESESDNFRETQPLNHRLLLDVTASGCESSRKLNLSILMMMTMLNVVLLCKMSICKI